MVGDPREVLIRLADSWKASALIVGSRGENRLTSFFLGKVGYQGSYVGFWP